MKSRYPLFKASGDAFEGDRDELIPFAETIDDPEAFRMFLKNYVPGEVLVYEQIKLPFL